MQSADQHSDPKQIIDKLYCSHHRTQLALVNDTFDHLECLRQPPALAQRAPSARLQVCDHYDVSPFVNYSVVWFTSISSRVFVRLVLVRPPLLLLVVVRQVNANDWDRRAAASDTLRRRALAHPTAE